MRSIVFVFLALTLVGCAQFPVSSKEPMHNDDKSYLKATSLPGLIIPANLANETRLEPLYTVPAGPLPGPESKAINPKPPGMGAVIVEVVEEKPVQEKE